MRLVTFQQNGRPRIGIQTEEGIIDLSIAAPDLPKDMLSFLQAGDTAMKEARALENASVHHSINDVHLLKTLSCAPPQDTHAYSPRS